MKYHIIAYLLGFQGEVEAANKEEAEAKIRAACCYPPAAPMIIQFVEEQPQI